MQQTDEALEQLRRQIRSRVMRRTLLATAVALPRLIHEENERRRQGRLVMEAFLLNLPQTAVFSE